MNPRDLPDLEQREYYAILEIWRKRDHETPSGILWRDWFKARFNRTIEAARDDYRSR